MIPLVAFYHGIPPIEAAIKRALQIVNDWEGISIAAKIPKETMELVLGGWNGSALWEPIAEAILEAQGWDLEALDDAIYMPPDHACGADAVAEWLRRGPTIKGEAASPERSRA